MKLYVLDHDGNPVAETDLSVWADWMANANRQVAESHVGSLRVSTVFLGLNHNFSGIGDPVLFETMIFSDGHDTYMTRCCTWDEAERMHAAAEVVAASWIARADAMASQVFAGPSKSASD